jgi:hypothetical protein
MLRKARILVVERDADEGPMSESCRADDWAEIVGYAQSIPQAVALAAVLLPDVMIVEDQVVLSLGDRDELHGVRRVNPGVRIFIVTDVHGVLQLDSLRSGPIAGFFNRARFGLSPSTAPR